MKRPSRSSVWASALLGVALILASAPAFAQPATRELVVFVNKDVKVDKLTREELKQIFLKKRTTWEGGQRIACINAKDGTPLRDAFRKAVLGLTAAEESQFWQEQKVRGEADEPRSFGDTVKAVFMLKGSVSYAFREDVRGDAVKVFLVLPVKG